MSAIVKRSFWTSLLVISVLMGYGAYMYASIFSSLPAACAAGDVAVLTDGTFHVCKATNTWTAIGGGVGGGDTTAGYLTTAAAGGLSNEVVVATDSNQVPRRAVYVYSSTADVTDSTGANTYTPCTELAHAVTSGTTYRFLANVRLVTTATSNGYAVTVTGPAATQLNYTTIVPTTSAAQQTVNGTSYNVPATTSASVFATNGYGWIDGIITPSANGTLQVQFMTEANGQAVVCKAGSSLTVW